MRALSRVLLSGAAVAAVLLGARAGVGLASPDVPAALRVGFGAVVLVGDGEVFVGEPANNFRPGTVYIYRKAGGRWQESETLRGPEAAVYDRFGSSLAYDGARLFIGQGAEAVHVYTRQGTAWTRAQTVAAGDVPAPAGHLAYFAALDAPAPTSAQFGTAVSAAGEWLLVGQALMGGGPGRGGGGGGGGGPGGGAGQPDPPPGAVHVFRRDGSGQYRYDATLVSPDEGSAGDAFGSAVALSGSVALIGAAGQDARAGVVHEFEVDAEGDWTRARSFAPIGLADGDAFGSAIVLDGERVLVAAPGDGGGHGAVYALRKVTQVGRGGGAGGRGAGQGVPQWQEAARIAAPAGTRTDRFGVSLAADDREVWVGAPAQGGLGGAYLFPVGETGAVPGAVSFLQPDLGAAAGLGISISVRGDVAAVGATTMSPVRREGVVIYERDASGQWRADPIIMAELDELAPVTGGEVRCGPDGRAGEFDCASVQLQAFLPPSSLTHDGHYVQMNDIWGWTDPVTGREWAILGRRDGTTFVDVTDPANPLPVADLPLTEGANPSSWRDMKVYRDHAYIVSDGAGQHGMQIFDLTRLRTLAPAGGLPVLVRQDTTYREIGSAHNIVINEDTGFAYAVGAGGPAGCAGGLHMIDIREPMDAKFAGCFAHGGTGRSGGGYSHDAQCVLYRGPDARYQGREICIGANETSISIADVTDKANPRALSQASYPNVAYAHQGWFTEDQRYWFLNDEIDENRGMERTRTLIWDLQDLENPRLAREHMGVETSTDHNLYIRGNLMYQANYKSGLRVLDVSDPENPREVGYFDTAPYLGTTPGYQGAWSVYPFFASGAIVVSSIEQGLFVVRYTPPIP